MPNVMAALPNMGGISVQCRKVWLTSSTGVPCSNAAKTRNSLKFAGVPQTNRLISATSGPKFTVLWERMEEILMLSRFFSNCQYVPYLRTYSPTNLCDGAQMAFFDDFLCPVFAASRVQHVSDLRLKFSLRPHHVCKYGRHPTCDG